MVLRHFLRCKICDQLLIVKEEKSNYDIPMTFTFYCGKCFSHFNGICDSSKIIFEGIGDIIDELFLSSDEAHKLEESAYVFEVSGDYPVHKPRYMENQSKLEDDMLSPYMRMFPELTDEERVWIGNYLADKDNFYFYQSYNDPNRKNEFNDNLVQLVKDKFPDIVKSMELIISTKFAPKSNMPDSTNALIINFLMFNELHDMFWFDQNLWSGLKQTTDFLTSTFRDTESKEFKEFKKFLKDEGVVDACYYRDNKILESIHKLRMKFLPALMLNRHKDKDSTVSTLSIEELMNFYSSNYEMILSNLDLAIYIENYAKRKSYSKFAKPEMSYKKGQILFNTRPITKGQKAQFIKTNFSETDLGKIYATGWINNSIRNGVYHRDFKFNPITQTLSFFICRNLWFNVLYKFELKVNKDCAISTPNCVTYERANVGLKKRLIAAFFHK